jgi:hypothetical protein
MKIVLIIFFSLVTIIVSAQDYPLTGHFQNLNEEDIYFSGNNTIIRPATGVENEIYDSLIFTTPKSERKTWFGRKLIDEHFIIGEDETFKIIVDPIIDFRLNTDQLHDLSYLNTRGIIVAGNLDSRIYFNSSFFENQGLMPIHISRYYHKYGVIPGYGRVKQLNGYNKFDFAAAYGNISIKANNSLNFTVGYDRLFIGDGYRSMILSDFSAPMIYFKINAKLGNFEYNNIFAKALNPNYKNIMQLENPTSINSLYPSKFISYNTLTYNLNSSWQFSLVEALVMSDKLSDWKVPIYSASPFFRTAYIDHSAELTNNLLGLNITGQDQRLGIVYSQFIIDKIKKSDLPVFAFQLGYKNFDFAGVNNLFVQLEYNMASSQMYMHQDNELHYGHFNQALAHPAGHKFSEILFIAAYSIKRIEIIAKLNLLKPGYQNIFDIDQEIESYENYTNTSSSQLIVNSDFQIIYNINNANKLQVFLSLSPRIDFVLNSNITFIQAGVRTAIRSNYYDY